MNGAPKSFLSAKSVGLLFFIALVIALVLMATGCINHSDRYDKTKAKQEANSLSTVSNRLEQASIGAGFTEAAKHALQQDPTPSKYADVAKMTLDRAQLAFIAADVMPPSAEILKLRSMVDGLLSTNAQLKASAEKELAARDKRLLAAEEKANKLEKDATKLQLERDKADKENALLADKWARFMRIIWWIGIGLVTLIVLPIVLRVVSFFVPLLIPVDGLVQSVTGKMVKGVTALFPKAVDSAGMVAKEQYHRVDAALTDVVQGIEQFKQEAPDMKDKLNVQLLRATKHTSVANSEVDRIKQKIGKM